MASGPLRLIGSYSFIDKDPAVDVIAGIRRKETKLSDDDLAVVAKLSKSTVKNLFGGKTVKPAHLTLTKLATALNHRWDLVPGDFINYETDLPKAWEVFHEHEAALKAKRTRRARRKKTNGK